MPIKYNFSYTDFTVSKLCFDFVLEISPLFLNAVEMEFLYEIYDIFKYDLINVNPITSFKKYIKNY